MESKLKKSIFFCLIIFVSLSWSSGVVWAATPVPEKESVKPAEATQPPEPAKKAEKFTVKGREYLLRVY